MPWICTGIIQSSFLQQIGIKHGCAEPLQGSIWSWRQVRLVSGYTGCPGVSLENEAPKAEITPFYSLRKSWCVFVGWGFKFSPPVISQRLKKEQRLFFRILKDDHHMGPERGALERNGFHPGFSDCFGYVQVLDFHPPFFLIVKNAIFLIYTVHSLLVLFSLRSVTFLHIILENYWVCYFFSNYLSNLEQEKEKNCPTKLLFPHHLSP